MMDKEYIVDNITKIVTEILAEKNLVKKDMGVKVGVSSRHLHLCPKVLAKLFGENYELKKMKDLMGGQYACEETVTIVGRNLGSIEKVRILGPLRSATQVEISKTDSFKLGLKAPLRDSGDIVGSEPITIIGPKGSVYLREGCIVAKRHIHMSLADAEVFGVKDNEFVDVRVAGEKGGILENVLVRVDKAFTLEMHIDTDEANAMDIRNGQKLQIIKR